jgi:hypothetical protein
MPAYLESSNPANTALYQRFGFERLGVIRVGRSPTHGPHAAHRTMIDVEGWVQRKTQLLAQYNRAALVEANEVKDVLADVDTECRNAVSLMSHCCRLKPLLLCPYSGSGFF